MLSTLILPTDGEIKMNGLDIVKDRQKIKEILNVSPQETAIAPNLSVKKIWNLWQEYIKFQKPRKNK